jgi:hypothetical protein
MNFLPTVKIKIMKFKELKFRKRFEGVQAYVTLKNGYEVSVIKNGLSYGGEKGLYEIGVYRPVPLGNLETPPMCDPLGWGDDVKGWLTPEGVEKELELIEAL